MARKKTENEHVSDVQDKVLTAALPLIPFDGWSDSTIAAAVGDAGVDPDLARLAFPRGGVDLALAFHRRGDQALRDAVAARDLSGLRYSERVAELIWLRLDAISDQREAVRRAAALFALPHHAADGAGAIWSTADAIWTCLGDTSRDLNWYTKRMTLSAVYSSVLLYWLGDQSEGFSDTRAFIDRRIDNVMSFEKTKARFRESPLGKAFEAGPLRLLQGIRAPEPRDDLPGRMYRG